MNHPTEEQVRERFLRLFVSEHTDGSYYYVTLRNTEESPEPCGWNGCLKPAELRTIDVEDGCSGGAGLCIAHYAEHIGPDTDGSVFYKPTGATAEEAWEGTNPSYPEWHTVTGWKGVWPLFAAPGWAQSDWPELES
jgi:hypothetical protein